MILAPQRVMFGEPEVIGWRGRYVDVRDIDKNAADETIRSGHYSGTVVWSSNFHLGVFPVLSDDLIGVLQFGPAMNPASGSSVVDPPGKWCELNRMWLAPEAPKNAGTMAISLSIKVLRQRGIEWIQTFADERCGKAGGLYQAASFLYLGSHVGEFYELDGEFYHRSVWGRKAVDSRGWGCGPRITYFNENKDRAVKREFRQYRYVRLLTKRARRDFVAKTLPYPIPLDNNKEGER